MRNRRARLPIRAPFDPLCPTHFRRFVENCRLTRRFFYKPPEEGGT